MSERVSDDSAKRVEDVRQCSYRFANICFTCGLNVRFTT